MIKSESIKNLAKALMLFQIKMESIQRDATNPFFKSKYASLNTILTAIQTPLAEAGLCFSQFPTGEHELTSILIHADSGEYLQGTFSMTPTKNDPQGLGSVITYQRRYALGSILGLNIDDDDDGNNASAPTQKKDEKAWLNKGTEQFQAALKFIAGGGSIKKIEEKYRINKEVRELLENTIPA